MTELQPLDVEQARQLYHEQRREEVSESTLRNHKYHLRYFRNWCREEGIDDLSELTGRDLHDYRIWRKDCGEGITQETLQSDLSILRMFLRFCESIDAVREGLSEKILLPSIERNRRSEMVDADTANTILQWLSKFHYASRDHAIFALLWHTGIRMGALHSLDCSDFNADERFIEVVHRPDEGTTLKNGKNGERHIALSAEVTSLLHDYVSTNRLDYEDEYGRQPLFTTHHGRVHKGSIRRICYRLTRPCEYGDTCPHDRQKASCDAVGANASPSTCPSSVSAHPLRRGSITHLLKNGVEQTVVSDRCDVSSDVLSNHYDERTEKERMEVRRGYLDNL